MKHIAIALLLAMSACGDDTAIVPDAAQPAADAAIDSPAPDAAPAGNRGCMGNLPTARTITINPGDPIPANLVNEIQDNIVGAKRPAWRRPFLPVPYLVTGTGTWPVVNNPANSNFAQVYQATGVAGSLEMFFLVPAVAGDRMIGMEVELYGNGALQAGIAVQQWDNMHSIMGTGGTGGSTDSYFSVPASWATYTVGGGTHAFSPFTIGSSGFVIAGIVTNQSGLCFGSAVAIFDRL